MYVCTYIRMFLSTYVRMYMDSVSVRLVSQTLDIESTITPFTRSG